MATKFYDIQVTFRAGGKAGPANLRYIRLNDIEGSRPRVALSRGLQRAGYHREVKDQWIIGCNILAEHKAARAAVTPSEPAEAPAE